MTQEYVHYTVNAYSASRKPCQTPKPRLRQAHGSARSFYFHTPHTFFSKAGCGKLTPRNLQFFGKFDLIELGLYIYTEKKPTHCSSQQVGSQVKTAVNVQLSASCAPQRPLRVAKSAWVHYGTPCCSQLLQVPNISPTGATSASSSQKFRGTSQTTLENQTWDCSFGIQDFSGGSVVIGTHDAPPRHALRANGIHEVRVTRRHLLSDSPKTKSHAPRGRGFFFAKSDFSVLPMADQRCAEM